jgi:hypothetical protein
MNIEQRLSELEARVSRLEKEAAETTTAVMVKCQYVGCANLATTDAIGGDENGDEHVYLVCEYHAREMEPYRL